MSAHSIEVTLVYALPKNIWHKTLIMPRGSTPEDLLVATGVFNDYPEILKRFESKELIFGVYSQKVDENYLLEQGDRVEIYRPLTADPKEVRRALAQEGKTMSGRDTVS